MSRRAAIGQRAWLRLAALVVVVNGTFPLLWIGLTSLKGEAELTRTPTTWLPDAPTLANYARAFADQPLARFIGNSLAVAALSTALSILVAGLAAYALARLRLAGRDLVLAALVAVATFPPVTLMVPLFQIMRGLGLLNSWAALVLPYAVLNLPVCTLVLVSFFETIPRDIESAAMIDGCTRLGSLWRVVVPLSAPGVFTAAILAFVNAWDEFLLALTLTSSQAMRTLPVGLTLYQGEFAFPWPVISAALVVALLPVVLLAVLFQERVVAGLAQGGLKG